MFNLSGVIMSELNPTNVLSATPQTGQINRRALLKGVGIAGASALAGGILAGCGGNNDSSSGTMTDQNILNFALNLEYLEAEYYLRAARGTSLAAGDIGSGAGTVTGGRKVTFTTPAYAAYAEEIAAHEEAHVKFLRAQLGSAAVSRPKINFTDAFNTAAAAAGIGPAFDPFADEISFLIGAFVFEDVGVTAYSGAAASIHSSAILTAAAGILGTEAYHAGLIRGIIFNVGGAAVNATNKISNLRATLGGGKDSGVGNTSKSTIVPVDSNALTYHRSTTEVLNIVYGNTSATPGLFFPNGLNGNIK
jgi:hypothetical protein